MALAIFDIDGTLINTSSEREFFYYLVKKRRLGIKQWFSFIFFLIKFFPKYGKQVFKKNKAYLNGLNVNDINQLAKQFVNDEFINYFHLPVLHELKKHLSNNDRVILLSGTLQCIADALAKHLKLDTAIATQCLTQQNRFTNKPPTSHPFKKHKLTLAKQYAEEKGFNLNGAYAYGDSKYDTPLLNAVGHAVASYPDEKLKKTALLKGWKIISAP